MQTIFSNLVWIILLLIIVFVFLYKKISGNPDAVTSKFKTKLLVNTGFEDARTAIEEALIRTNFKNVRFDDVNHKFSASTGFSMWSWSELIEVKLKPAGLHTEIEFKSICAFPTQLYDWGKNKRNFKRFSTELYKLTGEVQYQSGLIQI
ncbi:hypothetical protein FLAN108750_11290 [Flavobacterium antarcticum]|uniref:hypothetical protein n=1 Tax=Flavobacterium antarcticum TaxID=271155 RepID=UPI0003B39776|nr:hypothetical protein [Flavobacterium antarcticum]